MSDGPPFLPPPPPLSERWALFLDVDGTLVPFADDPEQVYVSQRLVERLGALSAAMDGALALVSGRRVEMLDRLFSPLRLASAGLHGLQRRRAGEALGVPPDAPAALEQVRLEALDLVSAWPGALVEDKGEAMALHWRARPEAGDALRAYAARAVERLPGYQLQPGDMVVELRPHRADKGTAIAAFLAEAPFRGRQPVFVGDDLTDEYGFRAVNAQQGMGVLVGDRGGSAARYRLPDIAAVHAWLGAGA
ncbi:trehalose-phosphatase [Luteimonas composti]|uniref:Trehalose 6-phosphate phosphatase n=1 Tax=Luteimonas composti TaxID=398257 RepID=A0ABT6MLY0_9GAMM|nr:trehalose-phosphatase [Luteimonas composti]MDH7451617.1 trehalose-phosphatase [Luteimonas composti]